MSVPSARHRCHRIVTVVFVALLLAGCVSAPLPGAVENRRVETPHQAGTALHVSAANGNVQVRAAERDNVVISAEIRAHSADRLARTELIAERQPDGTLEVSVSWPGGQRQNNESSSFEILLPDARGLRITTSNGRIGIEGLGGHAELSTSNGAIHATGHNGSINARSSNGRVTLEGIAGAVDVSTSNGRVTATEVQGRAKVTTSNGRVDVSLTEDSTGPIDIRSSNGSVNLAIGAAFVGEMELRTSRGRIEIEPFADGPRLRSLERRRAVLAFDRPGEPSRVRSSNGRITLRAVGEAPVTE